MKRFRRSRPSAEEVESEVRSHLAMAARDHAERGQTGPEAEAAARRDFGNATLVEEDIRAVWAARPLTEAAQDIRFAVRQMLRYPAFYAVAIATLALGIGACTSIFTFIDTSMLRPLPYPEPDRLVALWEANSSGKDNVVSPANFMDWRSRSGAFEALTAYVNSRVTLTGRGEAAELRVQFVTPEFFSVLRVPPLRGRVLAEADGRPGAPDVVILSHRIWQTRFEASESVLGKSITLSERPYTVIGVMPPGFHLIERGTDFWAPFTLNPARNYRKSSGRYLLAAGRLRKGVGYEEAQREVRGIAAQLETEHPDFNKGWSAKVVPLKREIVKEVRNSLLLLLGAVGLLLLIGCANVANLLLARSTARQKEMATRLAIGAGRWRLVRQQLTESLALGIAGAILGIPLAWLLLRGLQRLDPELARVGTYAIDGRVLAFAVLLAAATAVLFGLAPAAQAWAGLSVEALRQGGRAGARSHRRVRHAFVALQFAMTAVLLVSSGLLLQTFLRLQSIDPGLHTADVLTATISRPRPPEGQEAQLTAFFSRVVAELRRVPGMKSVSAVDFLPFDGIVPRTHVEFAGRPPAAPGEDLITNVRTVLPGYFETMGIRLLDGRVFDDHDLAPRTEPRFLVSRAFVHQYIGRGKPLDERIRVHMGRENSFGRIIGVVEDVREGSPDGVPVPTVYYVHSDLRFSFTNVVMRTEGDPRNYAQIVTATVRALDPNQPVWQIRPMQDVLGGTIAKQRLHAWVTLAFACAALLLAVFGIYGVIAYLVTERLHEIGVKLAVGATPGDVLLEIVSQGARLVMMGLLVGVAGAAAVVRLLSGVLYGVQPFDTATFVAAAGLLAITGLIAALVPARRASALDPLFALRYE